MASGNLTYRLLRLECFDPDELKQAIDGTQITHTLLPGGHLRFDLQRLKLGSGILDCGLYGPAILAEGDFPERAVAVGMVVESPGPILRNGEFNCLHSVQLYAENAELSYRAEPGTRWMTYAIDREALQKASIELTGRPLPIPETGSISFDPSPEAGSVLARTILETLSVGASEPSLTAPLAKQLQDRLHYDIATAVASAQPQERQSRIARERARRHQIVRRAEEFLRAKHSEPFSLTDLADATGVCARQVQYHFRKIYGMTPLAWFRSRKLANIRDELKERGRSDTRVTDVAMDWGFYHLGRFSREYRRLFGENPSDTLRR